MSAVGTPTLANRNSAEAATLLCGLPAGRHVVLAELAEREASCFTAGPVAAGA
jgi:hypothetical protein